jgi:hypothetical protein
MFQTSLPTNKPKRKRMLLPLLRGVLVLAVLAGALVFSVSSSGRAHAASVTPALSTGDTIADSTGDTIADIALAQIGGHCIQYNGCPYPGEWCAVFGMWVWSQADQNIWRLTAGAGSFYLYGQRHGTLSNTPHDGDAIVLGYNGAGYAQHMAIVVEVNTSAHTIRSVGGNERGGAGVVAEDGPYDWSVGYSSYWNMDISGYITPVQGQ